MTRLTDVQARVALDLERASDPTSHLIAAIRGVASLYEADAITTIETSARLSFLATMALNTPTPFATCEQDGTDIYVTMRSDGKFVARCGGNPQHVQVLNL